MSYDPDTTACEHGNEFGCSECRSASYPEDRDELAPSHEAKLEVLRRRARYIVNAIECSKVAGFPHEKMMETAKITREELDDFLAASDAARTKPLDYVPRTLLSACIGEVIATQSQLRWRLR